MPRKGRSGGNVDGPAAIAQLCELLTAPESPIVVFITGAGPKLETTCAA